MQIAQYYDWMLYSPGFEELQKIQLEPNEEPMSELTIHNAVLEQIKTYRLDSQQDGDLVNAGFNMRGSQSSEASWESSLNDSTPYSPYASLQPGWDMPDYEPVDGFASLQPPAAQKNSSVMLSGWLYKTSRPKYTIGFTRMPHEHRQHRKFKLTEHSLEYNHLLQRVCRCVSLIVRHKSYTIIVT